MQFCGFWEGFWEEVWMGGESPKAGEKWLVWGGGFQCSQSMRQGCGGAWRGAGSSYRGMFRGQKVV